MRMVTRTEIVIGDDWKILPTFVSGDISIGATILCGIELGEFAMIEGGRRGPQ